MKIFIDTNVLISAVLFPQGKVASVFLHLIENHNIVISSYSLKEFEIVFERKFASKVECLRTFIGSLSFELFKTPENIDPDKYPQIRDINDLPILVSAILSDSDILLTGDKDFEDIQIKKPLIFSPKQYFELIGKKDN
jgi:putative PIN family toxin of toxin-antitoxin system